MSDKLVALDANESRYFLNDFTVNLGKSYDVLYPQAKIVSILPIDTTAGPAAEQIRYTQMDIQGEAALITNYSTDVPRVSVSEKEYFAPVKTIASGFDVSLQEIRAGAQFRKDVTGKKFSAVKEVIGRRINKIALKAYSTDGENGGLAGLLYNTNVTKAVVTTRGGHVTFADKTADEVYQDLLEANNDILELTQGVEIPDTVLLPLVQYNKVATTIHSTNPNKTILQMFLEACPNIKRVDYIVELKDVNPNPQSGAASNTNCMVIFKNSPDKLMLQLPIPFEAMEPERKGFKYSTDCMARVGGVTFFYPLSATIVTGI